MKISGLTAVQAHILDQLWAVESPEQAREFIRQLPARYRPVAEQMVLMLIYETVDRQLEIEQNYSEAQEILQRFRCAL
jgi:hypothetical protein